jgi:hypothetical protein
MPRLPVMLIAAAMLCGCGAAAKKPPATLPVVKHPSASFARQMDKICKPIGAAVHQWNSNDHAMAYTLTLRMTRQLRRLHPPAGERQAFEQYVASLQRLADAYGRAAVFPDSYPEILEANIRPDFRLASQLADRLHSTSC